MIYCCVTIKVVTALIISCVWTHLSLTLTLMGLGSVASVNALTTGMC